MTTVAIVQSNYIPWKGYFDLIRRADHFVLLDSVQYTPRDWRNRNRIRGSHGDLWLSIPVIHQTRQQLIKDSLIADRGWSRKHWSSIHHAYGRAPAFTWLASWLEPLYQQVGDQPLLSTVNHCLLNAICEKLSITTPLYQDYDLLVNVEHYEPSLRLLKLCQSLNATTYLSGPAAKNYLDVPLFNQAGIRVEWMDYQNYPAYPQLHQPFENNLSIIDLLAHMGPASAPYTQAVTG